MTWRHVNPRTFRARARASLDLDARQSLTECNAPILYIASTRDEFGPRTTMQEVLAIAPVAAVAEIDGTYLAMFTNPDASAARIAEFLEASSSAPQAHECGGALASRATRGILRSATAGRVPDIQRLLTCSSGRLLASC